MPTTDNEFTDIPGSILVPMRFLSRLPRYYSAVSLVLIYDYAAGQARADYGPTVTGVATNGVIVSRPIVSLYDNVMTPNS